MCFYVNLINLSHVKWTSSSSNSTNHVKVLSGTLTMCAFHHSTPGLTLRTRHRKISCAKPFSVLFLRFSEHELAFTFAKCYRPSVVCLSVTLVHPTQAVEMFGTVSTALGTLAIRWHPQTILRRSSQGNPSAGGVKRDFAPIDGYISETVQDTR